MFARRAAHLIFLLSLLSLFSSAELEHLPAPPNPLPPDSLAILDQLAALKDFPTPRWEWHDGDIPHGEGPSQNDPLWKAWTGKLSAGKGSLWIRANIQIPAFPKGYELRGAALIFSSRVSPGGSTPEILYLNGHRIALGTDLEPQVLVDSLQPGQTLSVAMKLLSTSEDKYVQYPDLTLRFAAGRPDPTQLRAECLSSAVLLPTLDRDPNTLAADLETLQTAISKIDMESLHHGRQEAFDASIRNAEETLLPLKTKLQSLKIDAVGNSHIDAAWKWPWTETVEVVKSTFTSALQLMPEYPNYKYAQPDVQYDNWIEQKYPALFADMQRLVKEGRWDVIGGMWAEPDLNEPDGETTTRQILIGKRYIQSRFGADVKIGWNVDSFGYSWQLPQIYKKSGIDFFVTQKLCWNEENRLPLNLFWWQSPDGSSVLTYFPMSYNGTTDPVQMADELANARRLSPGITEVMHLYGVGDHGGGPTRVDLDRAQQWIDSAAIYPKLSFSTPTEFFSAVGPNVSSAATSPVWNYSTLATGNSTLLQSAGNVISVPVWRDELYLETHRGTYTAQARQKQNMRDSEEWLLDSEKLSSVSWVLGGQPYPQDKLNEAWKKVLFNTNHDLAAGSGIGIIYKDAQTDYDAVRAITETATQNATDWMTQQADTRTSDKMHDASIVIYNTLAWPRDGLLTVDVQMPQPSNQEGLSVHDASGNPVASQVISSDASTGKYNLLLRITNAPAIGFEVLHVSPGTGETAHDLSVDRTHLENSMLRVIIDPHTGCITHLVEKQSGFDFIDENGCGNQLQTFVDQSKEYDAWNIDQDVLQHMTPINSVESIEVLDKGPLRASLRIKRHWGASHFDQTIVLYSGTNRIDIENNFDWHETHILLKAAWPLRASSDKASFEIPYGVIDRPTTRNNSVDQAKYEVPALRWADLGDGAHGVSLLNNSKYGYDVTGHLLRLSLLRSPVFPDPDADRGPQRFIYSIYPHEGTWQTAMTERRGYEFNYPLKAQQTEEHAGTLGRTHSFLQVDDPNIILTAMKKSEDGNALILRAYDWSGKLSDATIHLPGSPLSAFEADMMEHTTGSNLPLSGSTLHTQIHPYEIQTLRVEYAPTAP